MKPPCPPGTVLSNIRVILVEPRSPGNIGSVARAMKNMGLRDLAVVGGGAIHSFWARAMAVHGEEILKDAQPFGSLREAATECGLVVGTTSRQGPYRSHSQTPRSWAPKIVTAAERMRVALVFGPEDHGLTNHDLKYCQGLITIPTGPEYRSLNVAQAVMICLYEILLASMKKLSSKVLIRAPAENVEQLYDRMKATLLNIGFLNPQNPEHIFFGLRRIFARAGLDDRDVLILSGLFHQIDWIAERDGGTKEKRPPTGHIKRTTRRIEKPD